MLATTFGRRISLSLSLPACQCQLIKQIEFHFSSRSFPLLLLVLALGVLLCVSLCVFSLLHCSHFVSIWPNSIAAISSRGLPQSICQLNAIRISFGIVSAESRLSKEREIEKGGEGSINTYYIMDMLFHLSPCSSQACQCVFMSIPAAHFSSFAFPIDVCVECACVCECVFFPRDYVAIKCVILRSQGT